MARINKVSITLCALLFTSLSITPLSHASEQARTSASQKSHQAKADRKKKTTSNKTKSTTKTSSKKKTSTLKKTTTAKSKKTTAVSKTASTRKIHSPALKTASVKMAQKCSVRKGHKKKCVSEDVKPLTIADAHKARVQKAKKTAMNKLMDQIGKPYRWGGTSPRTGFDCSGLVYYAYKDLVKFRIPRTANEMYHLRDARSVNRGELQSGDLVFFRTRGRGTADHVGVYVGNGKFIQSPRTGRDIQITSLSEDYWANHYVGARRVMTPKTIR
ncbi:C40 family peptidase [Scandinavium goeteborgense]|uniref:Murein DD-endopeptidase n=1 Tax=Scandinavium goeteborgense TaxID=1851514 RepID=A0A4V3BPT6_SCAGO|nr:C40 family peptidase [Scandinavium goeteborgense]TDN60191.1 murein DD-endopeptidase [Scandinavium goeteborgense]